MYTQLSTAAPAASPAPPAPGIVRWQLPELRVYSGGEDGCGVLSRYITQVFDSAYGARIGEFMPLLVGLFEDGMPVASLGLRRASGQTLFCERYLDQPVEYYARTLFGDDGDRGRIMELGNLAVTRSGYSMILYLVTMAALREARVDYLLFAANRSVRRSLKRCGFTPQGIDVARAERLPDGGAQWGSYYASDPMVMLADIELTARQAATRAEMVACLEHYAGSIRELAEKIQLVRE
ncbi:thermostable hemolysin [Parahaliea mediterranea]|uniref:Thermostable hemolysin n=1 Tax=Parahaliea mediterranea TaxID=651086 RepID=A0A939DHT1_9GAMM|nr:thermostable hemolysin [Parahaliea mediterranea]MBN7798101.1 thermostable hemolysin [Parahaliea mediterranea]